MPTVLIFKNVVQKNPWNVDYLLERGFKEKCGVFLVRGFFCNCRFIQNLRVKWENNSWNIEELKLITLAIDCLDEDINWNNFIEKEADYILVLKTYYEKNKNS